MAFYAAGRRDGSFETGIQRGLESILVDPEFLFRIERDPEEPTAVAAVPISDLELASRLSFFLWSSIPDDELLDAAAAGRLREPAVLERQVRRMLADARAQALVDGFAMQWLGLRRLQSVVPAPDLFPEFDDNLREAFEQETRLFVRNQLREDRSVLDLLRADYTYVNERLARHYGIPNVYGSRFRKVTFDDGIRGGLLGTRRHPDGHLVSHAHVARAAGQLGAGAHPRRAAAAAAARRAGAAGSGRGRAPGLGARAAGAAPREPRVRELPRPHGPAGISRWSTSIPSASGARPARRAPPSTRRASFRTGPEFDGLAGLKTVVLSEPEQFVQTVAEKLTTYALGRGVQYYDMARHPADHAGGRPARLHLVVARAGDRPEYTVPDAQDRIMIITRKAISRRTVLRGLGTTLALPLLDSMAPALTAASKTAAGTTHRLGIVYVPNGIVMEQWTPATEGAGFELTPTLEPLARFRERMDRGDGPQQQGPRLCPRDRLHQLSDRRVAEAHAGRRPAGRRVDGPAGGQGAAPAHAARVAGARAGIGRRSRHVRGGLHLRVHEHHQLAQRRRRRCRWRSTRARSSSGCWATSAAPIRPARARAHRAGPAQPARRRDRQDRAAAPRSRGARPQTSSASTWTPCGTSSGRIQMAEAQVDQPLPEMAPPVGIPATFDEHAKLMFDLQVLAYQADLTRVITFMVSREFSSRTYPEIGVPEAHHPTSHHRNDPEKIAKLARVNAYHTTLLAYYLDRLQATSDGEGSLLDQMTLLYGCGLSDGQRHSSENLPVLVVGGAGGRLAGGRHLRYPGSTPMSNLHLTLMDSVGVPVDNFGNSTGPLDAALSL